MSEAPLLAASAQPGGARGEDGTQGNAVNPVVLVVLVELPRRGDAVPLARKAVLELADELHPETMAKLLLLVTELVGGAMRSSDSRPLRLVAEARGTLVRAELMLASEQGDRPPVPPPHSWGLFLVDRIAERWGTANGRVWFELRARPPRRVRARPPRRFARGEGARGAR